jgi:hypothetical protein
VEIAIPMKSLPITDKYTRVRPTASIQCRILEVMEVVEIASLPTNKLKWQETRARVWVEGNSPNIKKVKFFQNMVMVKNLLNSMAKAVQQVQFMFKQIKQGETSTHKPSLRLKLLADQEVVGVDPRPGSLKNHKNTE